MRAHTITAFVGIASLAIGWGVGRLGPGSSPTNFPPPQSRTDAGAAAAGTKSGDAPPELVDIDPATQTGRALTALLTASRQPNYQLRYRDSILAVSRLGPGDIQAALAFAKRSKRNEDRRLYPMIIARWAETDPKAAATFALAEKGSFQGWQRQSAISSSAAEWARRDPAAAKAWALGLEDPADRSIVAGAVASGMVAADPDGAFAWLQALPQDNRTLGAYSDFFRQWSTVDPLAASRKVLSLPFGEMRINAMTSIAASWADSDPTAALGWARSISETGARNRMLATVIGQWAATEPLLAAEAASEFPAGSIRNDALGNIITYVGLKDIDAAISLANEKLIGNARNNSLRNACQRLSYENPGGAAKIAIAIPEGPERDQAIGETMRNWASQSPADAMAFIEANLPEGTSRKNALSAAINGWAQIDPKAALEFTLKNGTDKPDEIVGRATSWASLDAAGALAWAKAQKDGPTKALVIAGAIAGMTGNDPDRAKELATPQFLASIPDDTRSNLTRSIANELASNDPVAAADWAASLSDPKARAGAFGATGGAWAAFDPVAAAAWLDKLPAGGDRDSATSSYARAVISSDPEGAAAWAVTIQDSGRRINTVTEIFNQWTGRDKPAATAWLQATPSLSAAEKQALLPK